MKNRAILQIIQAHDSAVGDMVVKQPFPSEQLNYPDPFVLLHHGKNIIPEDFHKRYAGVDPHPHRGFSPVTFVFEGAIHHQDSRGNDDTIYQGGVQWMHAGMGIVHSERPVQSGLQEIIQLWVNSPESHKKDQPSYQSVANEAMPKYQSEDGLITISVVSGTQFGLTGKIRPITPVASAMILGKSGGTVSFPITPGHQALLYVLSGKVKIGNHEIAAENMALFADEGDNFELEMLADTKAIFISGQPIGEKIIAQGPFVVNHEVQIMEAYRDYRMGKMGILIEN